MTQLLDRRRFALLAGAALFGSSLPGRAQAPAPRPRIADMHSHLGLLKPVPDVRLREQMEATGTGLVAWALVDDQPWIRSTGAGIAQVGEPRPGDLWNWFLRESRVLDARLLRWGLPKALTPADVDAAMAGTPHVVMASESANFLEGDPGRLAQAHAMGLRHLQLVHYIASPLGDLQTTAPRHNGMPAVAREVIEGCRKLGILVDLAHSTPDFVDQALEASQARVVWSHSWIRAAGGRWQDWGYIARSLAPQQARKIAARGGVIGLWSVRARRDSSYPIYSIRAYADEIVRMADIVGPQAVGFGTDLDGAGPDPVLATYADLREVVNLLVQRGLPEAMLEGICGGNYARVLKQAMAA
ncbi:MULTISPECIES: dipeptidase [Ramlibacter]|nr:MULTISPECIES: membrane dipeptidase [Ramlibacter]MBA2962040.1 membrane dipeptidase [Ramlibacter sp. CGMCC 1.13660]